MRLAWTDRALARVRETARYIAADDSAAAVRWAEGLFDAAYRVFYRIDAGTVLILTIRHASQLIREDEVGEGRT